MQIVVSVVLLALFWALYVRALEGCPYRPIRINEWLEWLKENGPGLGVYGVSSAFWYSILLFLIYTRIINRYWIIPTIICLIIVINLQRGFGFEDHGFFNRAIVLFAIFWMISLFFIAKGIVNIWRRGKIPILICK